MSIVSRFNDVVYINGKAIIAHRHENANAVQLDVDAVPDYANAPQLPTVNQFRKIRVPSGNPRAPPKGTKVPVKFMQEGDDYARTETYVPDSEKLKPAKQPLSDFRELLAKMVAQEETYSRAVPFDYNAGIKPSARGITISEIAEPTGQQFRP